MRFFPWSLLLGLAMCAHAATADPVWDPSEIARLTEQAAQFASGLSATIDNLQALDRLAGEIGAAGPPKSFASPAPAILTHYSGLRTLGLPSADDAISVISNPPSTATERERSRQLWDSALKKAAADGLAVSQVATQDLTEAKARSRDLAAMAANAPNLRSDVQANSAVCLAVLSELGAVHAVLALLLEERSIARLAKGDNGAGPS